MLWATGLSRQVNIRARSSLCPFWWSVKYNYICDILSRAWETVMSSDLQIWSKYSSSNQQPPFPCSPYVHSSGTPRWSCCDQYMQFLWIKYATAACLPCSQLLQQWAPLWCLPAGGRREGSSCSVMRSVLTDSSVCSGVNFGFPPLQPELAHSCLLPQQSA